MVLGMHHSASLWNVTIRCSICMFPYLVFLQTSSHLARVSPPLFHKKPVWGGLVITGDVGLFTQCGVYFVIEVLMRKRLRVLLSGLFWPHRSLGPYLFSAQRSVGLRSLNLVAAPSDTLSIVTRKVLYSIIVPKISSLLFAKSAVNRGLLR